MTRRVVTVAAVVLLAGTFVLWLAEREPDGWTRFGGERQGWTVAAPSGWGAQFFTDDRWCEYLGYRDAVVVTGSDFEFHGPRPGEPEECVGRFILADFPRDEVAFAVQPYGQRIGLFQPTCLHPPIALEDMEHGGSPGGPMKVRFSFTCPEGDDPYPTHVVRAWIGRDASAATREHLERVLASFRFLRDPTSG